MPPNITLGFNVFWLSDINRFRLHSTAFSDNSIAKDTCFTTPALRDGEYLVKVVGTDMKQVETSAKTLFQNYFILINRQDLADMVVNCTGHTRKNG